jgi:hypothetical protein
MKISSLLLITYLLTMPMIYLRYSNSEVDKKTQQWREFITSKSILCH